MLAVVFALSLVADGNLVDVKKDRFTGDTNVSYSAPIVVGQPVFLATWGTERPHEYMLAFAVAGPRWRYQGCKRIDWLIDDKPADFGVATRIGDASGGPGSALVETVFQKIDAKRMGMLAAATSVEYRLCGDEHKLTVRDIQGAAEVFEASKAGTP